jgi:cohesin complex subunit SA-1/2
LDVNLPRENQRLQEALKVAKESKTHWWRLGEKVLDETESPDNSLVAALLQSYKGASKNTRAGDDTTIYTPQLEAVARRVIQEQKNDPNSAQTQLLNLLFRSVGGSVGTNLDPGKLTLEDMDDEEWASVVTDLVDEMRHTSPDRILFCADPSGAAHAAVVASGKELDTAHAAPSSAGVREYRKIYEEFWYVLGTVALTEGVASKDNVDDSDDDDSTDENRRQSSMSFTTTTLFDAEVVRDLILRVTELITVGQPDVRAAATVAALQLGHAVLNRTVELGAKLDVATRQYEAASRGKKDSRLSKKASSFRQQMDSLKRTKADLEEIVSSSIIHGVFMHRFRDSNLYIRATTLKSLSRMTIQRPDLFLVDKYLKYFGWMVSDKAASVRVAGLEGLHAPFLALEQKKAKSSSRKNPIDLQQMVNVITKFLPKIADCVLDTNVLVQEKAMSLLLSLEREGFLDEVMDDNLWMQINLKALSPQTTPTVRRDALYFVMDQLEAFDEDEAQDEKSGQKRRRSKDKTSLAESSERMMVQRIDALASWYDIRVLCYCRHLFLSEKDVL